MKFSDINKKKIEPPSKEATELLAQKARLLSDYYIMCDSVKTMNETLYPKTFFKNYETAFQKAEILINSGEKNISLRAAKTLFNLRNQKERIFDAFLFRCNASGKLTLVKNDIIAYRDKMPKKSYKFFELLTTFNSDKSDNKEYIFCSVVFSEGGKAYYYLSDNGDVRCGDHVTVPVGNDGEERIGRVVKTEVFKGCVAPYPVDKLKYITGIQ